MKESEKKRQITKISILITSAFVIFFSVTYAFLNQVLFGIKHQAVIAERLELELKEGDTITLENVLPMHDEVGMMEKPFEFSLVNKTSANANYTLKLKDVTEKDKEKLDTSLVKYGLTKDATVTKDLLSNLTDNSIDTGTISRNQTIKYSLRLWIDSNVKDEELIRGKTLSYKIEVKVDQTIAIVYPETSSEIVENNLGENCKTYDDGVDTFLVGQCQNNYVWYSGKLWRVVLKNNETGAVKMVTDNAITSIPYNASDNKAFENSYMDQWLNQEFLPTLHDYQDYLVVDSTWDATLGISGTPSRPVGTTSVTRTVGFLNAYEYYTTYNKSDGLATYGTVYLNNGGVWVLMTPDGVDYVWGVREEGGLSRNYGFLSYGVRPSMYLKSNIRVIQGSGIKSEPYRLEGDSEGTINGTTLLSTRYSGEYITFNNELYRIVGVEGSKTKITTVDKPATLSSNRFHSILDETSFANASIKTDLETYYQGLDESVKNMIVPNTTWYLGTVGSGENYKASICKTVHNEVSAGACERTDVLATASIGLPRVGEMFTSQITRGRKTDFWTLTPFSASYVLKVDSNGDLIDNYPVGGYGVRPSMYLNSNVTIARNNTGDGIYEHPYDVELRDFYINNNAIYATTENIELSFVGSSNYQVCVSNTEDCTEYEPFLATKSWKLSSGDGEKTVYVYYKYEDGSIEKLKKSIILDTTPPTDNSIQISSEGGIYRTLTLSSTGADFMCFSNKSSNVEDCVDWVPYTQTYDWTLTKGNGEKIVYAFFKDKVENLASTSSSVICSSCAVTISEDFEDIPYHSALTIRTSTNYPWSISNGILRSNTPQSQCTISFTPTEDSKLSFDVGKVRVQGNYCVPFKITLINDYSGVTSQLFYDSYNCGTASITADVTLRKGVTYTLNLLHNSSNTSGTYYSYSYIDNLLIESIEQ